MVRGAPVAPSSSPPFTPLAAPKLPNSSLAKRRLWFSQGSNDLIVWLGNDGQPRSFRFCYDKDRGERAVTWVDGKFSHALVDAGERHEEFTYKQSSVLIDDVEFDAERIYRLFVTMQDTLPPEILAFVGPRLAARAGV